MNYADLKIGKLVQTVLKPLIIRKASSYEVLQMQELEYSKKTFGIQYPLLLKTSSSVTEKHYYSELLMLYGETYRLCCEWYETAANNDRPYVENWIREHEDVAAYEFEEVGNVQNQDDKVDFDWDELFGETKKEVEILPKDGMDIGFEQYQGREDSTVDKFQVEKCNVDNSVIKAEALRLEEKANAFCRSESISDQKRGVELFLQAHRLEWKEVVVPGRGGYTKTIPYSDEFLRACQNLAITAFKTGNFEDSMRYCKYVRSSYFLMDKDILERDMFGTSVIHTSIIDHMKKRPGAFNPELCCAELEILLCSIKDSPFYNLQEALYNRKRAAAFGSIDSIKILGNHYYEAATNLKEAKEAYFYYDLLDVKDDSEFAAKKRAAWNKYISMLARNVTNTLLNPKIWMPPIEDASVTWEHYSGLTEEVSERLPRKPLYDAIILNSRNFAGITIKSIGDYQPGTIDLDALWKLYVNSRKNKKVDKQILFIKIKKYNENLYIGDFVDCCKYLWEQTYKK